MFSSAVESEEGFISRTMPRNIGNALSHRDVLRNNVFRAFLKFQETKVHVSMRWCETAGINETLDIKIFQS